AFGGGALAGALLADPFVRLRRRGLLALALGMLQGAAIALVPLAGVLLGASLLLALAGAANGVLNVFYLSMLQQRLPSPLLGRSVGAQLLAAFGARPVSVVVAGTLVAGFGPAPMFLAAGLAILLAFAAGLSSSVYRNL